MQATLEVPTVPAVDVTQHLRLALKVVRRYERWAAAVGVSLEDLEGEAFLALVRAGNLFDPQRGCQFSTFAYTSIAQRLRKLLKRHRVRAVSLSELGADEDSDFEVADPHRESVSLEDAALVKTLLAALTPWPRLKDLLERHFGLDGQGGRSMSQLAAEECLSDGRMWQLISRGLEKMRAAVAEMGLGEAPTEDVA